MNIIKKYYSNYSEPDELLSIGSLGLIKAVDSFKSEFGTKFATYGAKCIQNEILMFFRSKKKDLPEVSINETIDIMVNDILESTKSCLKDYQGAIIETAKSIEAVDNLSSLINITSLIKV